MNRILIIEDEAVIRNAVKKLLERNDYAVDDAESVEEALQRFDPGDYQLIIADIRLPGKPGTEMITLADGLPVLIMTSYASVRSAVDAMKLGAADYISKPFDHEELLLVIRRLLRQYRDSRTTRALKSDLEKTYPVAGMIGNCPAMLRVCGEIEKVSPTDASVLILGESGTGKELVARAIHERSRRSEAPFITVNCAAIPESLVESELFGHTRGAFTGAEKARTGMIQAADGGTLFLDEIGELPVGAQARLLRVLQDGEMRQIGSDRLQKVDIRLLAATNRNLKQMVEDNSFRSDLYFRLQVVEITLPPLRERDSDALDLARTLLKQTCSQMNRPLLTFTEEALQAIGHYHWPGNVRELKNAIERAVILSDGDSITTDLLGIELTRENPSSSADLSLEDYFKQYVLTHQNGMTETELARQLGISRKTLWERRQKLGIPRPGNPNAS
ncbi:MAG TPA: sigma-54-dependent Fis family transcriptional regulator [Thiolapillus brandeum]|uniref:Sigma-54-dependent Fis family transcriptional regulator n=1 Tax=Thiolapillus brandeum TaxID=1076588 RepID=A0A831RYH9_9GAMM|nr:sigma-54-dependent Fis family transcriptional regulator [Thiolapillus brandeum]